MDSLRPAKRFGLHRCVLAGDHTGLTVAQEQPNVLFITLDDLNTDLGTYGHPLVRSPSIDQLASEGLRFDAAYAQYPVCTPSRTSFLTGLYPQQTGVLLNGQHFREFVPDVVTLPEFFARHGYFTARVGKIFHAGVPGDIGTDGLDDLQSWDDRRNPRGIDLDLNGEVNSIHPGSGSGGTLTWLSVPGDGSQHTDSLVTDAAIELLDTGHPQHYGPAPVPGGGLLSTAYALYRPRLVFRHVSAGGDRAAAGPCRGSGRYSRRRPGGPAEST